MGLFKNLKRLVGNLDDYTYKPNDSSLIQHRTASTNELQFFIDIYKKILPIQTFPFIPLIIAAFFQSLAWMSGPSLFYNYSLLPRLGIMWLLAGGEYLFMMPAMNASIEVLNKHEPLLVVIYQVITLIVFIFVNVFIFKKGFQLKYLISFVLLGLAVFVAYL
jgi:uncharacterized protein (DUF486 family)